MANEPSTRDIFVGRETERKEFHELLRKTYASQQIYHLYGGGGTGKTRLLEWMVAEAKHLDSCLKNIEQPAAGSETERTAKILKEQGIQQVLATSSLVDFYKTGMHTPLGLLKEIARQLGLFRFIKYSEDLESKGIDPNRHPEEMSRVQDFFLQGYQELTQNSIVVLLFDTFEAAGWAGENLLSEQLATISSNTLFVIVGRQKISFLQKSGTHVKTLTPLTPQDAISFFRQRGLPIEVINDEQIRQITGLIEGRPIYLALAADWLAHAEGTIDELISPSPVEDMGHTLVRRVLQLRTPENKAILYLAVIWRLGDPGLLAHLLELPKSDVQELIGKLGRFSFVKYRPPAAEFAGSCLLHDEMRDLIIQHCWPEFDRTGEFRKALIRMAISYYEGALTAKESGAVAKGHRRAIQPEMRNYQAEWLYYQLQLDSIGGFARLDILFRDAAHHRDMSFCQQLLDEIKRPVFFDDLSAEDRADIDFKQGLVLYRREKYQDAEYWWSRVTNSDHPNLKSRATSLMLLTELLGDRGQAEKGLEFAHKAKEAYQELSARYPEDIRLKREMGELYNNWGRLLRIDERRDEAIAYYKQTLDIYKGLPDEIVNKGRARTSNNLGYVYYELGDIENAQTFCLHALQLRQKLDFPYELGLSYNTMGMVYEEVGQLNEAADMYSKALETFDEDRSDYGRGLVLINQGRMYRANGDLEKAQELLLNAYNIFKRLGNRNYFADVLNELGCVYRDQKESASSQKAEKCFRESIQLSEENGWALRKVDNLIDMVILYEQTGKKKKAQENLTKAQEIIDEIKNSYFQGQIFAIKASMLFETDKSKKQKDRLQAAFDMYLNAANQYTKSMDNHVQFYRAKRRYEHIVDEIMSKLKSLPDKDISFYAEYIKKQWPKLNDAPRFNQINDRCEKLLGAVQYF